MNPANVAVPPDVVTLTEPVAPVPTTAVICVAVTTLKLAAAVPPKLTAVAPVRPVPVIVTVAPAAAVVGVKELIVVAVVEYVNPVSVAVPPGVVTLTEPVAPLPTIAVICVAELTRKLCAAVPPKLTAVAPDRLLPVIIIVSPDFPVVGANPETAGFIVSVSFQCTPITTISKILTTPSLFTSSRVQPGVPVAPHFKPTLITSRILQTPSMFTSQAGISGLIMLTSPATEEESI